MTLLTKVKEKVKNWWYSSWHYCNEGGKNHDWKVIGTDRVSFILECKRCKCKGWRLIPHY